MSEIPEQHHWNLRDWESATTADPYYWVGEQPDSGATQLYLVQKAWSGGETIMAQKCYLHHAIEIVDALRRTTWRPR